ncbi:MAG: MFS transporter, partial [Planctomycetales bacterium]|nr:MFS transporter [Planctomycetales bacterium]
LGIGLAPLVAWWLIGHGWTWRQYYWLLAVPGLALGATFVLLDRSDRMRRIDLAPLNAADSMSEDRADWRSFFTLTILAMMQGFVYSAVMSFLPRYLTASGTAAETNSPGNVETATVAAQTTGMLWASGALLAGCVGQYLAGRFAKRSILEQQLTGVTIANVPFLLWMAVADGTQRFIAAALFALVHFMHQPIYNTLIAKYSPKSRRSLCYGFSFAMGLGLGSLGATFNGYVVDERVTYGVLAATSTLAACLGVTLTAWNYHID